VFWYGLLRLFTDYFRDYDSYWFGVGTAQYFNLLMWMVGLGLIFGLRRVARQEPEEGGERRNIREEGRASWTKRVSFYALVAFCLLIPSGTTQWVLKGFTSCHTARTCVMLRRASGPDDQ